MKLSSDKVKREKGYIDKGSLNLELEEKLLQFTNLMIYITQDKETEFLTSKTKKKVR